MFGLALEKTTIILALIKNESVGKAKELGFAIEREIEFESLVVEAAEIAEEFQRAWPTHNADMAKASLNAYHAGDYKTAEDLSREAQGYLTGTDH